MDHKNHNHNHNHYIEHNENNNVHNENFHGIKEHVKQYDRTAAKKTIIVSMFLVGTFMTLELVGGLISGSLALVSDSIHMLTDFISLLLAFFGMVVAQRAINSKKTYGYSRFEIIMSLVNSLFLVFICGYIIIEALIRIKNPQVVDIKVMLPVAVAGLFINFLTMYLFYRNKKHDSKNHNHENLLMKSAFLHFLSDAFGSVVAITSGVIIYYTSWYLVDPILSILLIILILRSTAQIIFESVHILMEGSPKNLNSIKIKEFLENNIEEVINIHHIHIWMLNEQEVLMTLHALINPNADIHKVASEIKVALKKNFNIYHSTVQVEISGKKCLDYEC